MEIELKNISFQYDHRSTSILRNINLKIEKGDVVALMGASGSGKSTLVKIISSFLKQTSGEILINGNCVQLNKPYPSLAYVSQSSLKTLFPWLTVEKNIYYPNKLRGTLNNESVKYCDDLLSLLNLDKSRNVFPLRLSGGGQKRLSLAMALSYKPEIILLDEPFSGIDFKLTEDLWDILYRDFQERKPTVLFITHSLDEASILADKTVFLKKCGNENDKELYTLYSAEQTVVDYEKLADSPAERINNPNISRYKTYLLTQFNKSLE